MTGHRWHACRKMLLAAGHRWDDDANDDDDDADDDDYDADADADAES